MAFIGIKEVNVGDKVKVHTKNATYVEMNVGDIVEIDVKYNHAVFPENWKIGGYLIDCDERKAYDPSMENPELKEVLISTLNPEFMTNISHDYYLDCKTTPIGLVEGIRKVEGYTKPADSVQKFSKHYLNCK